MKPGMKMLMMSQMQRQPESNRSEYGGGNRRMIGYDRDREGNANTSNYGGMEGGGSSRNYAENRMEGGSMNYGGYGGENNRMEYGGGSSNYGNNNRYGMEETENRRRRDSRGRYMEGGGSYNEGNRSEYNEGRYGYGRNETESRRRRDRRGRYMMEGMDEDEEEYDKPSQVWYPPNMMGGSRYGFGDVYADVYASGAMNRPMSDNGDMGKDMSQPVDEHTARKWVEKMDGGEHFKPEQAEQLRATHCPDCGKWEWYTAINAMYSDYCETAKKMGVDKPEFYAGMARDFLKDKDAKTHKLRRYMEHIAR